MYKFIYLLLIIIKGVGGKTMAAVMADGKKSMTNYDLEYKECSFYNGHLVIKNVPYLKLSTPTPTGETSVKDSMASLIIAVMGEEFKANNYQDESLTIDYNDLKDVPHIQNKVNDYLEMFED